jgi:glucosamine--fructose-6-phosphate aminotransferase (isomerizing)
MGYVGDNKVTDVLIEGLQTLEYRGYDSAGISTMDPVSGGTQTRRARGRLEALRHLVAEVPAAGGQGIAHTRWATHGEPTVHNAHPHHVGGVSVVHNGIIENHQEVRSLLKRNGAVFSSDTDTELIAHLVSEGLAAGQTMLECMSQLGQDLEGAWAVVVMWEGAPDRLFFARMRSPLVLAKTDCSAFISSDISALLPHTNRAVFLEDGDYGQASRERIDIRNSSGVTVTREESPLGRGIEKVDHEGHPNFMHKEIYEQPQVLQEMTKRAWPDGSLAPRLPGINIDSLSGIKEVVFVACGTSAHAGMVGEYCIESIARLPARTQLASEFRYRNPVIRPGTLVVGISQSGETADTLAAMEEAERRGATLMGICNVKDSAMDRLCRDHAGTFQLEAGPEIGVASTKAFTAQVLCLELFARQLGYAQGEVSVPALRQSRTSFGMLPLLLGGLLEAECQVEGVAKRIAEHPSAVFLGRNILYPVALEGALKLKEISYIHAEGYAAGEMKHGPLALVEPGMPLLAAVPSGEGKNKILSNLQEAKARGAWIVMMGDPSDPALTEVGDVLALPDAPALLEPILVSVLLQLVAYYGAQARGTDVDKPRNLAKSVTVE